MVARSFTIQLDGTVSLGRLTSALEAWQSTLSTIAENIGQSHVLGMKIDDLSIGSAIIQVEVEFDAEEIAIGFSHDYNRVGVQVRDGNILDLPVNLKKPVKKLREAALMDGASGLTLSSDEADILIRPDVWRDPHLAGPSRRTQTEAIGVVIGKLQSLTSRNALKVTIYDIINDKAVRCILTDEQHELARDLWDSDVMVEGLVRRDPATGRPLSIRDIRGIRPRQSPVDTYAWMKARGVLSRVQPESSSEDLIRQARNG